MMATWLALAALVLAVAPAGMMIANLWLYRRPPRPRSPLTKRTVSVLIPARDEQEQIGPAIEAALANRDVELEVVVLDDGSVDRTAAIVDGYRHADRRVRLVPGQPLPPGANGKQHACAQLGDQATGDWLVFIDADVRLAPDALVRILSFVEGRAVDLASGIPRQVTGSFGERLVVPLIHFVLLAFLPLGLMRRSRHPAYAAGIGQLFVTSRAAYDAAGGHQAILSSRHDGLDLPRAYRKAGRTTDLFDATELASCRMYSSTSATWRGFLKNADGGLGHPAVIVPATVLLLLGQVAPPLLWVAAPWTTGPVAPLAAAALAVTLVARLIAGRRFRQDGLSALLHPLGVAALLAIQWHALLKRLRGRPASWKGRAYSWRGSGAAGPTAGSFRAPASGSRAVTTRSVDSAVAPPPGELAA